MPQPRDHYGDGDWYDAEYVHIGGDISYYEGIAHRSKTILELACGTGRLTIPMASAGAEVVGIDRAAPMIDRALRKRARLDASIKSNLSFREADMRTLRLPQRFDAVVLGFNTIMHMITDEDLFATLVTARHHLTNAGRFFLDLHTPLTDLLTRDPAQRYDPQQMIDPATGTRYIVTESSEYDPRQQINVMRFYYQPVDANEVPVGEERYAEVRLRVLFPRELDHWLHCAGMQIVEDWDDFERTIPFTGRGGRRVLAAARR
ncbi:MAG: class I SAM-dependent methyltransferase [Myxococcota bacterium]